MEHLRFCGSLNIACGYAGEQGFCTLTRCPVVLDEFQAMRRYQGPTGPKGRPGGHGNVGGNMKKSTCRGCGAPIVWIRTAAGKSMPCDAEPVLSADIGGLAAFEPDGVGHVSHFATCPAAEQFRRKGAGRRGEDGQENGVPDLREESSVCRRP